MAKVWTFQHHRESAKGNKGKWSVGWYEGPKKRSKTVGSKTAARQYAAALESRLNIDEYSGIVKISWAGFREEYMSDVMSQRRPGTRLIAASTFNHVERILSPKHLQDLTRQSISRYAKIRLEEGNLPSTVNKELRVTRTMLNEAVKRKCIGSCPHIAFLKEPKRIPSYVSPEDFAKLYEACDVATEPQGQGYTPGEWWRAYLVFLYMTGWRMSEPLSLTKESIDWETGRVYLDADDNKGNRDEVLILHPIVIEHLEQIKSFGPMLFDMDEVPRQMWRTFGIIQKTAGVQKRNGKPYGFHCLRRGFATMNATRMSADALQKVMRHKNYATTQLYINLARQIHEAVPDLFVPNLPKVGGA